MYAISTEAAADCRTNDEIIASIKAGNRDDIGILWEKNLQLVRWIIDTRIKPSTPEDREDLEQQAFFGFMDSLHNYHIGGKAAFSTYVTNGIVWSLQRYYNRGGYVLDIPYYVRQQIQQYSAIKERRKVSGEPSGDLDIMDEMGIPPPQFRTMKRAIARQSRASLDISMGDSGDDATPMLEVIAAECDTETEAVRTVYLKELHKYMTEALKRLPDNERAYITAHYYQGYPLDKIADIYGCTKQNIDHRIQYAFQMIRRGKYSAILQSFLPRYVPKEGKQ